MRSLPLRGALRATGLAGCLIVFAVWGLDALARHQIPFWAGMGPDQKRCHLEAWLSGHPAVFGAGRCESLE